MAYVRPTDGGLIRPSGLSTGGALTAPALVRLTTDGMVDSITDPNGLGNGAWTTSSGRIQIPVSIGATHSSISAGLRGYWPLPTGLIPGSSGVPQYWLAPVLSLANPTGAWAVHLGIVEEAATRGVASGIRYKTGGPGWAGQVVQWGNNDSQSTTGATLGSHIGSVQIGGQLGVTNGVSSVADSAVIDNTGKASPAASSSPGLSSWAAGGTPRLCLVVTYHGVSSSSVTLDCLVRYALMPLPAVV